MDKNKITNPLNETVASVGEFDDQVGTVDEFEMNQAEKTQTLQEHPVNESYDGPEPKVVDENLEKIVEENQEKLSKEE